MLSSPLQSELEPVTIITRNSVSLDTEVPGAEVTLGWGSGHAFAFAWIPAAGWLVGRKHWASSDGYWILRQQTPPSNSSVDR